VPSVTLRFNLPDEAGEYKIITRAGDFYCAILEIQKEMRQHWKYGKKMKECWNEIEKIIQEVETDDIP